MNVLVWFKRDLRLFDHPALQLAAGLGRVLPLHVVEPDRWAEPDLAGRHWEFTAESLTDLREALAQAGAPLVVRVGDAISVLERMCRQHKIKEILSLTEQGSAWETARNQRVADWAAAAGIRWRELASPSAAPRAPADSLLENLEPSPTFAPAQSPLQLSAVPGVEPGSLPAARFLRLAEDRCPHRQLGGRAKGLALLESFLTKRGETYREAGDHPLLAERASSRLSPYLASGALSAREVTTALQHRRQQRPGRGWGGSFARFEGRLLARDAFLATSTMPPSIAVAEPAPQPACQPAPSLTDALPCTGASRLQIWREGKTGLPFLDAAMRYLAATGWLAGQMRSMVASVACRQLGLDWQETGATLAQLCTDYDPGLHWPLMQLHAGQAAAGARVLDPVKIGQQLDPDGTFIRRWIPELAPVPAEQLHTPWRWQGARHLLGRRYPEPVIDPATATRAVRETLAPRRNPPRPRPARNQVVLAQRGEAELLETPAAPRLACTPDGQLSLGL